MDNIQNLAKFLIAELGIQATDMTESERNRCVLPNSAHALYLKTEDRIKTWLKEKSNSELGEIAGQGQEAEDGEGGHEGSLYQVHYEPYLNEYAGGRELLVEIACTAIVAEMYQIFLAP